MLTSSCGIISQVTFAPWIPSLNHSPAVVLWNLKEVPHTQLWYLSILGRALNKSRPLLNKAKMWVTSQDHCWSLSLFQYKNHTVPCPFISRTDQTETLGWCSWSSGQGVPICTSPSTHHSPCHLPISTIRSSVDVAQRRRSFSQFCSSSSSNLVPIYLPRCDLPVEINGLWPQHPEGETRPGAFADDLQSENKYEDVNLKYMLRYLTPRHMVLPSSRTSEIVFISVFPVLCIGHVQ